MPEEVVIRSASPRPSRRRPGAPRGWLASAPPWSLLALWTFAEYLPALGWAGVIAIATWPFYLRCARARPRRARAHALPALFAIAIGLVFLAPVVGAGWFVGREAQAAVHWLDEARKHGVAPPEGLEHLKYVGPAIADWWRENLADPAKRRRAGEGLRQGAADRR